MGKMEEYRRKRKFDRTTDPSGEPEPAVKPSSRRAGSRSAATHLKRLARSHALSPSHLSGPKVPIQWQMSCQEGLGSRQLSRAPKVCFPKTRQSGECPASRAVRLAPACREN